MKKKTFLILNIIVFNLFVFINTSYAQPTVTATYDSLWICEGDSAYLLANAATYFHMDNDFDNGTLGAGWIQYGNPMFTNPCLPHPSGTTYMWMGPAVSQPRYVATNPWAVSDQCEICFDMVYATQSQSSPCEGPDMSTEGVHLQYSTDGGVTWTDINYWDPNGGYDPQMTAWNNYCEQVPAAAAGGATMFQWYQDVTSSNDYDHWGLDNVQIFCPAGFVYQVWEDSNGAIIDSGTTAGVQPNTSDWFFIHVEDSTGATAFDSTYITVYPTPNLSIDNLDPGYCITSTPFQLTTTPSGGDFSGPLVDAAGMFDPNLAGAPGNYDVTYNYYQTYSYWITGVDTFFTDDFSTDMGWTGYGTEWTRGSATISAGCSGSQDPDTDNSPSVDNFIIGNYLGGCYPTSMAQTYWLTSPIIDCSVHTNCAIDFYSHSGCESSSFDHIYVDVFDGATWTNVYSNAGSFSEDVWTNWNFNVSAQADNNPNFQVRFGLGTTDGSVSYKGWNIDDFRVMGDANIHVTDTLCDFSITEPVAIFNQPDPTFTFIDSICINTSTIIDYIGGATGATFTWDFNGGVVNSGTNGGPYDVHWTTSGTMPVTLTVDVNGCISDTTLNITVLPFSHPNCCILPVPDAGPNASECGMSYIMQAVASVGTGTWTQMSGPGNTTFSNANSATATATVDQYGTYWYSWFEDNGTSCGAGDSVEIQFVPAPAYDFTITDLVCNSVCQGEAVINIIDSVYLPLSYQWDMNAANQTTQTAVNLCAGSFDVTVTNTIGCSTIQTAMVTEPTAVTSTISGNDPTCYGYSDGDATVVGNNGTPGYTYIWDTNAGSQVTATATALSDGTYSVTVEDANGCSTTTTYTLTEPTQVTATTTMTLVSCFGGDDGTTTVIGSGGTGAFTYEWSDGQTTQTAINLQANPYMVTVSDANSCTATATAIVTQPSTGLGLTIDNTTDISCYDGSDGSIEITVSGGTPGYLFSWDSGDIVEDPDNLQAGTYCVTVTDANNCTISNCATLTQPTELTQTTSSTPTTCYGGNDGSATVIIGGGTPPYTYLWSNGGMGSSISNVQSSTYTVTATDAQYCTIIASVYVDQPDQVVASVSADSWMCIGECATLNISATGGTPGYTFEWCHGEVNPTINVCPTTTTTYCGYAKDVNGCISNTDYVTVNVFDPITIDVSSNIDEICIGDPVILSATAIGGNGNYTYTLTNNGAVINPPHTVYPGQNTTYTILASDNCGSPTDQASVAILVNPLPPVTFMPDTTSGCQPLTVEFLEINQDDGQTYLWNFGDYNSYNTSTSKNPTHIYNNAGIFTVGLTVTSQKGCKNTDVYQDLIEVYELPVANFVANPEIASIINPNIYFTNFSTLVDTCFWYFGDGDSTSDINPHHQYYAQAGTYIVELYVESEYGCRDTSFNEIRIKDEYTFFAPTAFSPDNDLSNDEFFVTGNYIDENEFTLYVFNRWGEVIFETNDINQKWNGRAKGTNKKCQLGSYTWLAIFKDKQGVEHQESGAVTIIR